MPWARAVITAWVLAVVPMLAFALVTMVLTLPRMLGTAWASAGERRLMMLDAWDRSDLVAAAAHALAMAVVVLPVLAAAVMLYRLGRQLGRSLWTRTAGRPLRRAVALVTVGALVAALVWAWWPREGTYRPIAPWERGTLADAVTAARPAAAGLAVGSTGSTTVAWPQDRPRPTRAEPQLALVLVPHTDSSAAAGATPTATEPGTVPADQTWVFPVDQPLAPGEGDNQALAVNTTDGSTVYDTAFAMVWVEKGAPAQNVNEAWALASCTDCAAVSVAFQVVLTLGDTATAVPQNVAVSLTSNCVNCLTYALAVQLFVTLDGTPSRETLAELDALWAEIAAYGKHLQDVPLSEIQAKLTSYEQQIVALLVKDGALTLPQGSASPSPTTSPTTSPSTSPSAGDTASDGAAPGETAAPSDAASTSPGASPSASVDPSAGPSSSPDGSPSASPTAASSPTDAATSGADAAQPTAAPTAAATP